jgi:drug/metabolite transporter (DMT)-like permease
VLKSHRSHTIGGFGLLALAQIMVAINIVGSKYLVAYLPVLFLITARFLIAATLLLPMHWLTQQRKISLREHCSQFDKTDWLLVIAQAVCAGALFNVLMVLGLRYTDAQTAGIITSTLPALIAVASWLVIKDKFTVKKIVCVACATLGLIVISAHQAGVAQRTHSSLLGEILVLAALVPEATYYVLVKLQKKHLPIFLMSGIINAINVVILIPVALWQINWHSIHLSGMDVIILIAIGLSSGFFYTLWFLGANKVDAILASLATAVMPIATVIIAWLALGETITIYHIIGMTLAIISIIAYTI